MLTTKVVDLLGRVISCGVGKNSSSTLDRLFHDREDGYGYGNALVVQHTVPMPDPKSVICINTSNFSSLDKNDLTNIQSKEYHSFLMSLSMLFWSHNFRTVAYPQLMVRRNDDPDQEINSSSTFDIKLHNYVSMPQVYF